MMCDLGTAAEAAALSLTAEIVEHGRNMSEIRRGLNQIHAKPVTAELLDEIESMMLNINMPPAEEMLVTHAFCNGLYIREGNMPAGTLVVGHDHKADHHCVVLCGRMKLFAAGCAPQEIVGPCAFVGRPGRKLVYVTDAVIMQNIHPTADWPEECFRNENDRDEWLYNISTKCRQHREKHGRAQKTVTTISA